MAKRITTLFGKSVRAATRIRGGGSAFPGLVVEKIDKNFIADTLAPLPYGTVIISGTNGKTTTTKMVVELLQSRGLRVFTNRTGSNFTRGVAAALLGDVDMTGKLHADIAVLELDEAHATHFIRSVQPRYCLMLNVMRDQLDRFGEIDTTARLLQQVVDATTDTVVLNREDLRIRNLKPSNNTKVVYYGLSESTRKEFPNDEAMHGTEDIAIHKHELPRAKTVLEAFTGNQAVFSIENATYDAKLAVNGIYNTFNAAGALALVSTILPDAAPGDLVHALEKITPAFGRGETITLHGQPVELVLVKNPSGFRLGLKSFAAKGYKTYIAINDNYADGRDMSWLWDVDFASLQAAGVDGVSGVRAYDMALRLQYDEISVSFISQSREKLVAHIVKQPQPTRIYCTYTAMLEIRTLLAKHADVEEVL